MRGSFREPTSPTDPNGATASEERRHAIALRQCAALRVCVHASVRPQLPPLAMLSVLRNTQMQASFDPWGPVLSVPMGSDGSRACQYRLSSGDQASSAAPYHALRRLDERRAVQLSAQLLGLRVREWPFRPKAPTERTTMRCVRTVRLSIWWPAASASACMHRKQSPPRPTATL